MHHNLKGGRQSQCANCLHCGMKRHATGEIGSALGVICHKCKKIGHFNGSALVKGHSYSRDRGGCSFPRDTELLSQYSLDDHSLPERTRDLV